MYFIPQKNKWYSWVIHTNPRYRYGLLLGIVLLLFIPWYYGLYPWLDVSIEQERVIIAQLEQQLIQQSLVERQNSEMSQYLLCLKHALHQKMMQSARITGYDQWVYIFDQAQKIGLQVIEYAAEQEKNQKSGKQSNHIAIVINGSFEQIRFFLQELQESGNMIQCTMLSLQRIEEAEDLFSCRCNLQCIQYHQ